MKKQPATTLFTQISVAQLENLTSIVTETLAVDFNTAKTKIFTSADLWNIQRQAKSRTQRRFAF